MQQHTDLSAKEKTARRASMSIPADTLVQASNWPDVDQLLET